MTEWRKRPIRRARGLRRDTTDAEAVLWRHLRNRSLAGRKFRRQHSLGRYIVDFVCLETFLVVEVDGGQHAADKDRDVRRTEWLNSEGFRVLRFWNNEVLSNIDGVLITIESALKGPHPNPLPRAGVLPRTD